ncbi:MAG: CDP-2,3-bis-(O-geranylgeranyl)-sn-glycerol synthase [Candidatus Thermoplasmatota archaeon]
MVVASILHALLVFLPAYVANMSPVLVAKLIPGWKAPIDGGRLGKDGKRLLGPGKTWRGLAGGTLLGAATAVAVALLVPPYDAAGLWDGWDYGYNGFDGAPIGSDEPCNDTPDPIAAICAAPPSSPLWAIALFGAFVGFMALVGDAVKSYFKRRTGRDRGRPWVPFDQLDFVVFGLLAMAIASPLLADGWVKAALLDDWVVLATLIVLTPLLHFLVNVLGYVLKLKEVWW